MNYTLINITSFSQKIFRVRRVQFVNTLIALFLVTLVGCQADRSETVKQVNALKGKLELKPLEGKWYYENKPFNGYAVVYFPNGELKEKTGYIDGKREGISQHWNLDGKLSYEVFYVHNRKNGVSKNWNSEGVLISESKFVNGVVHGIQTQWYPSGKLFKRMTIVNGKEEGLQQTWWENGKLYVNYEAKNGRVYGLKRSSLCYELKNEVVQK